MHIYLLAAVGILFSSSVFAITCPDTFKKISEHKVQVPSGWCWAPNIGRTKECYKVINLKKLSTSSLKFKAALWTKTLQGPRLPQSALCYYNNINTYVLYSEIKQFNPPAGKNWQSTLVGLYCQSPNPSDCSF